MFPGIGASSDVSGTKRCGPMTPTIKVQSNYVVVVQVLKANKQGSSKKQTADPSPFGHLHWKTNVCESKFESGSLWRAPAKTPDCMRPVIQADPDLQIQALRPHDPDMYIVLTLLSYCLAWSLFFSHVCLCSS